MAQKMKLLRDLKEGEKLAPQMRVIIEQLKGIGIGKEIERPKLIEMLEKNPAMVTRQPVDRIVAYYAPHLKDAGLVEFSKPEPKPAKEKPAKDGDKPAAGAAAAEKPAKANAGQPAAAGPAS